jgi:hypothetical protein
MKKHQEEKPAYKFRIGHEENEKTDLWPLTGWIRWNDRIDRLEDNHYLDWSIVWRQLTITGYNLATFGAIPAFGYVAYKGIEAIFN